MPSNFWMIANNERNFRITQERGFNLLGLKSQHRRKVQRISQGDRILLYVTHIRRFVATATATSDYFESEDTIWEREGKANFPYRVQVNPDFVLRDEQFMDANQIAPRLEYVKRWPPEDWHLAFQGNLHLLPKSDFILIEEEMKKLHFGKDYQPTTVVPSRNQQRRRRSAPRPAAQAPRPAAAPASPERSGPR